ncbi:MAG: MFS transporter [Actinomycetota bacterium]
MAAAVFLVSWGTNTSTPFLIRYQERLDLGDSATMAIFTVYVVGIIGTLPLAGPVSDRFGRRAVVIPFTVVSALSSLVLVLGRDEFLFLLLGRFLLGVVSGAVLGVSAAWLQELMGPGREERAAVLSTLITFGGFGFGPPISAAFDSLLPHPLVLPFVVHAVATVAVLPTLIAVPETTDPSTRPARVTVDLGVTAAARPLFWRIVVPAAVWVFAFPSTSFALFPVILSDAIPDAEVWVAAISGVVTAWAGLLARPILTVIRPRVALVAGMAMGATGYLLGTIAFATDAWPLLMPAAAFLGCAAGTITAGALGVLASIADPMSRGALNSTFYLLAYPSMAMPIAITGLGAGIGLTAALIVATGTVTAVIVSQVTVHRNAGSLAPG